MGKEYVALKSGLASSPFLEARVNRKRGGSEGALRPFDGELTRDTNGDGHTSRMTKPSDTHEQNLLWQVFFVAYISMDRVLGTLPVVPVFAPIRGCSCCMQSAAMSVKAIAAITTSDFMIFPDGKTYQGIS